MMTETTRAFLKRSLTSGYQRLRRRLTAHLGSPSLAADALQETYLKLEQGRELAPVANAEAYLYRTALNIAYNLRKSEARHRAVDIDDALELADDAPGPDRVAEVREQVAVVMAALSELTQREREAFLESFLGDVPPEVIAKRFRVGVRTIQADVRNALIHCAFRLGRKDILASGRVRLSRK